MNFDQYIAELLEDHDCVIVPDFGGFVANYAAAKVNPINHRFDPPYRKVSFNKLLVHNDGLLASYVARKEEERYEDAVKNLKNYVLYLKDELRNKKKVDIRNVGILIQQTDGTFRFEQVKNPAFFREGFGLDSFFGKPVQRGPKAKPTLEPKADRKSAVVAPPSPPTKNIEQVEPDTTPIEKEASKLDPRVVKLEPRKEEITAKEEAQKEKERKSRRVWPYAAAALIGLPIIGYAVWVAISTPLISDRDNFQFSDLNPFKSEALGLYEERVALFEASALNESDPLRVNDKEDFLELSMDNAPDKTLVVRLTDPKRQEASNEMLRYHVIGGCFSMDENAERMVEKYQAKGSNAAIIDRKGSLARVSIASYATKKEALQALASYQNDISGAWLLYK